jgi:hypothetical protein
MIRRRGLYFLRIISVAFFPNEPVPPVIKVYFFCPVLAEFWPTLCDEAFGIRQGLLQIKRCFQN